MALSTTIHPSSPSAATVRRLEAEVASLRTELATVRVEREQLRGALADLLAEQVRLRAHLTETQEQLVALDAERQEIHHELVDLLEVMRQQAAIHIDETSWRVDGVPHWLWVFVNDVVALYVISRSRGSKVPQALLGPDFDGVVITDFFSAYSPLDVEKAKCWAHLLRDSHDNAKGQATASERTRFHRDLHALYVDACSQN